LVRTTVDLPDELFRALQALAVQRGTSLRELLRTAVEHELARARRPKKPYRVRFPVLNSKEPGKLDLTNAGIEDFLA
jgi:metal-responsive CopG/Arc/MetJ family transcriptional regulator